MSKDIVERKNREVAKQGGFGVGRGFEKVDMESVSMPRIKVMQGLSPELQDEDYNFKMGDIVHGLLMEKMPEKFIPLSIWSSRTLFVPRRNEDKKKFFETVGLEETESMFVCRSLDGKNLDERFNPFGYKTCAECMFKDFEWDGNSDTPPLCTHTINVLALFEDFEMPAVIQFANTNFKYGKKFRELAMFSGGDLFSKMYKLTSKKEQNDQGVFYVTPVKPAGKVEDADLFKKAEDLYSQFSGVSIEVEDAENVEEEATSHEF